MGERHGGNIAYPASSVSRTAGNSGNQPKSFKTTSYGSMLGFAIPHSERHVLSGGVPERARAQS